MLALGGPALRTDMSGIEHNAHRVALEFQAMGPAVQREVGQALDIEAQLMARAMQREAPKDLSTLTLSIHVEAPEPHLRDIGPGVDYAYDVHEGRKPGKGLPWYLDPAAKPLQDWLERHLGGGPSRAAKPGTPARQSHEQALRNIYIGWSRNVKRFGMPGNPFAERAFEARQQSVFDAITAAIDRGLQAQGA